MSAFVLSTEHISYLVRAAVKANIRYTVVTWGEERAKVEHNNADRVGAALLAENIKSVAYRYGDAERASLPGPVPTPVPSQYHCSMLGMMTEKANPVQVLKAIACYEYQTCEHPAWETSQARQFCDMLRLAMIHDLPGYEDAEWEITGPVAPAPAPAPIKAEPVKETRYISTADTAKLIRTALKQQFPGVKFSVRSSTYSGGCSIDIGWTDGPTQKAVERVTGKFSGASFDGMQDLKTYHDGELDGEPVHFCADYVFCHRDQTRAALEQVAEEYKRQYGIAATVTDGGRVEVETREYGDERRFFQLQQQAYCDNTGRVVAYVAVK